MQCKTFHYIDPITNQKVFKSKKKFIDLKSAITTCKIINSRDNQINKVVSYKCKECHSYHIGRNGKPIKKRYF